MALTSMLMFHPAINYPSGRVTVRNTSTIVQQATDNDYNTFTTEDDLDVNVANANGNATEITHIALKTKNVDTYSFTPSGGAGTGFMNRAVVSTYQTLDGRNVSAIVNGLHNEIYELPSAVTATSVRLQVNGTGAQIYNMMFLRLLVEIPDGEFVEVSPRKVDRAGRIHELPNGNVDRGSVLGAQRWKWETAYRLKVTRRTSQTDVHAFLRTLQGSPDIILAMEPARYPDRWFPAAQTRLSKPTPLRTRQRQDGHTVPFVVSEQ